MAGRHDLTVHVDGHDVPATVIAPARRIRRSPVVVCCYPGGGYGRGYFDLRPAGLGGYSQAAHHAAQGYMVVAVDHADAALPDLAAVARLNALAAEKILDRLELGRDAVVMAVGQSMGAALLTVQQAEHDTFDAIALLGWSAVHTALPGPPEGVGPRGRAHFRWAYHWDDEPPWLVDADIGPRYPEREPVCPQWGSATRPVPVADVLRPGCVAPWAAQVDVPVLLGFGERDVAADPGAEPAMYPASPAVTVARFERVAHMHNFGPGRRLVWDRLTRFYRDVAQERRCPTR